MSEFLHEDKAIHILCGRSSWTPW